MAEVIGFAALGLIGGLFGGKIALKLDPGILQKIFAVVLVIIGVKLLFK